MEEAKEPEYLEKTPTTGFRKCHKLEPENGSLNRDWNPHSSISSRLLPGKHSC